MKEIRPVQPAHGGRIPAERPKSGRPFKTPALTCLLMAALFILSLGGCAGVDTAKTGYYEALNRWTRAVKIYEGLESRLYLSATYKHPSFRAAYIERYAKSYQMEEAYTKALLDRESEQGEKYNEFFFTAFTPEDRWNDFLRPDSVWKLYLVDSSGARLAPVSVTRVDASDPLLREFFPYFDLWSAGYIVKFPKYSETGTEPIPGPDTRFIKLIVTGILGKGELEWRLKD